MGRLWVALLLASPALAHGPAPAVLEAVGSLEPPLYRSNIGLALQRPDGLYRYICPARWGAEDRFPPAARLDDGRIVVAHEGAFHVGDPSGCTFEARPFPASVEGTVSATLARGDAAWTVVRGQEDSWILPLEGAPVRVEGLRVDSARLDSQGVMHLAAARPTPTLLRWDGALTRAPIEGVEGLQFLSLSHAEPRFLIASVPAGRALLRVDEAGIQTVLRAVTSMHGPIPYEDGWLALADGVLHHDTGSGFASAGEVPWTCLQATGERRLACVDFGLSEVDAPGETRPLFDLHEILGPACPEPQEDCDQQWLHFAAEAGLLRADAGLRPEVEDAGVDAAVEAPATKGDEGCSSAPRGAPGVIAFLLPCYFLRRLRRARDASCP